ncbi:MAG: M48 family metalloprotease [Vicinamibacterales bacterium]
MIDSGVIALLVAAAVYAVASTVVSAAVAAAWTAGLRPRSAAALFALRLSPVASGGVSVILAVPAFVRFEPVGDERVGPVLVLLAGAGTWLLLAGIWRAARALTLTARLARTWRRGARPLDLGTDVRADIVDLPFPIVAVVGVVRPRVVIATGVASQCSADELRRMAAHEQAHVHAGDNLKRLLLDCAPDVLRLLPAGAALAAAWDRAAEDAADDSATGDDPAARATLAGALVKVARLAVQGTPHTGLASTLIGIGNVERRVRRLVAGGPSAAAAWRPAGALAAAVTAGAVWLSAHPEVARGIHAGLEELVRFGR